MIENIKNKFQDRVEIFEKSKKRIYITVNAREDGKELIHYLFSDLGARLSIASGVDKRAGIEILYHMTFDKCNLIVTVRVLIPKPNPEMLSCTDFLPAAEWIEREIYEMFGVKFIGHPNLEKLLTSDDWPEGVYPLRKEAL